MISPRSSGALLAASLLLAACSTPSQTAPIQPPALAPKTESKNLRRGMTEAEIRSVWGAPKAIEAGPEANQSILVYEFDVHTSQQLVATNMVEVPAYDPIDGRYRKVMEPVLTPQTTTLYQIIELRLRDGRMESWSRRLGRQRSFN